MYTSPSSSSPSIQSPSVIKRLRSRRVVPIIVCITASILLFYYSYWTHNVIIRHVKRNAAVVDGDSTESNGKVLSSYAFNHGEEGDGEGDDGPLIDRRRETEVDGIAALSSDAVLECAKVNGQRAKIKCLREIINEIPIEEEEEVEAVKKAPNVSENEKPKEDVFSQPHSVAAHSQPNQMDVLNDPSLKLPDIPTTEPGPMAPPVTQCLYLYVTFSPSIGKDWGELLSVDQKRWMDLNCDPHVIAYEEQKKKVEEAIAALKKKREVDITVGDHDQHPDVPHTDLLRRREARKGEVVIIHNHTHLLEQAPDDPRNKERLAHCRELSSSWGIEQGITWGRADKEAAVKDDWKKNKCDSLIGAIKMQKWLDENPHRVAPIEVPSSRPKQPPPVTNLPVIAVCICTTTRSIKVNTLQDLVLFKRVMPSIREHAEDGFEYWVYLTYDIGDPFLDRSGRDEEIRSWFVQNVQIPLKDRNIETRLVIEIFQNDLKKPGPAFNWVTHMAYIDGAEWIYRINDDTEMLSKWAKQMTTSLLDLGVPYGVAGPLCNEGNTMIFTHDLVHRLHHEIFTHHYPPSLADWWMDDYITRIYGSRRAKKVKSAKVKHNTGVHGTRYDVDFKNAALLSGELELGRFRLEQWLEQQNMRGILQEYKDDIFDFRVDNRPSQGQEY